MAHVASKECHCFRRRRHFFLNSSEDGLRCDGCRPLQEEISGRGCVAIGDHVHVNVARLTQQVLDDRAPQQLVQATVPRVAITMLPTLRLCATSISVFATLGVSEHGIAVRILVRGAPAREAAKNTPAKEQ